MDGKRVDAAFELTDKCFVDHAVALEPAPPAERLRHNMHPEMSLPALPMPGMSGVPVGFVHHVDVRGSESLGQLLRYEIAPCHGVRIAGAERPVNAGQWPALHLISCHFARSRTCPTYFRACPAGPGICRDVVACRWHLAGFGDDATLAAPGGGLLHSDHTPPPSRGKDLVAPALFLSQRLLPERRCQYKRPK